MALLGLLTLGLYWLRDLLAANGQPVADRTFFVVLLAVLGGAFGLLSKLVLRATGENAEARVKPKD
jgi:hypothetical protein